MDNKGPLPCEFDRFFKAFTEKASAAIMLIDGEGEIIKLNPVSCRLFSISPEKSSGISLFRYFQRP